MFSYENSIVRQERLARGTDHCGSKGTVYSLKELLTDGLIMDPTDVDRPLTTAGTSPSAGSVLIYAVDANFNIRVSFDGIRGSADAVKHETLFHNVDVRAAGELSVRGGIIIAVNDRSGSYRTAGKMDTDRRFAEAVLTAIDRAGGTLADAERARLREQAGRR